MIPSAGRTGREGTPAYVKLPLQVLADCVAVSMIVLVAVGLLPGAFSGELGTLFVEVWLYTILIAAPAHWILPGLLPIVIDSRPAVQWAALIVGLTAIGIGGSLVASVIVFALGLEPGASFGAIASVTVKLSVYLALLVGIVHALVMLLRDRLGTAEARLRERELEYERGRKLAAEARLAALEARVHPHFFFNALNTISSLIPTAPERAERLIERMSALLRFSLDAHQEGLVPLEQEMKIVRDYLDIEQARFGERLRYALDVDPDAGEAGVPPLSVQTLAENSVKYAVAPAQRGAEIRIRARRERDGVRIEVADNGAGFSLADMIAGHGLDTLRSRLAVLFGDSEPLEIGHDDGWTVVSFRVPA